jgi:hypothetical protein
MTDFDLLLIFSPGRAPNAGTDVIVGAGMPGCHQSCSAG